MLIICVLQITRFGLDGVLWIKRRSLMKPRVVCVRRLNLTSNQQQWRMKSGRKQQQCVRTAVVRNGVLRLHQGGDNDWKNFHRCLVGS